jgi:uncharacterized UBP type Zn finger protein
MEELGNILAREKASIVQSRIDADKRAKLEKEKRLLELQKQKSKKQREPLPKPWGICPKCREYRQLNVYESPAGLELCSTCDTERTLLQD